MEEGGGRGAEGLGYAVSNHADTEPPGGRRRLAVSKSKTQSTIERMRQHDGTSQAARFEMKLKEKGKTGDKKWSRTNKHFRNV